MEAAVEEDSDNPLEGGRDTSVHSTSIRMTKSSVCSDNHQITIPSVNNSAEGNLISTSLSDLQKKKTVQLKNAKFDIDKLKSYASKLINWKRKDTDSIDLSSIVARSDIPVNNSSNDSVHNHYSSKNASKTDNRVSSIDNNSHTGDKHNNMNNNSIDCGKSSIDNHCYSDSNSATDRPQINDSQMNFDSKVTTSFDQSNDINQIVQLRSSVDNSAESGTDIDSTLGDEIVDIDVIRDRNDNVNTTNNDLHNNQISTGNHNGAMSLADVDSDPMDYNCHPRKQLSVSIPPSHLSPRPGPSGVNPLAGYSNYNSDNVCTENDTSFYNTSDNEPLVNKTQPALPHNLNSELDDQSTHVQVVEKGHFPTGKKSSHKKKRKEKRGTGKHRCSFCPKRYPTLSQLIVHTRYHTGEEPFPCSYCDRRFKTSSHRKYHETRHKTPSGYALHQGKLLHDQTKNSQGESEVKTKHQSIDSVHSSESQRVKSNSMGSECDAKVKVFDSIQESKKPSMKLPKKSTSPSMVTPSEDTGTTSPKQANHSNDIKLTLECLYCERVFKTPSLLEYHEWTHGINKSFNCKSCKKSFRTIKGWRKHMKCHAKSVTCKCQYCHKVFSSKSNKQAHERKRCPVRRKDTYPCGHCGLVFAKEHIRRLHEQECVSAANGALESKAMTNVQKYTDFSPKKSKSKLKKKKLISDNHKSSLMEHSILKRESSAIGAETVSYSIQSGLKGGLRCPICNKQFSCRGNINRHLRNVHKKEQRNLGGESSSPKKPQSISEETDCNEINGIEGSQSLVADSSQDSIMAETEENGTNVSSPTILSERGLQVESSPQALEMISHCPSEHSLPKDEHQAKKAASPQLIMKINKRAHHRPDKIEKVEGSVIKSEKSGTGDEEESDSVAQDWGTVYECQECGVTFPTWKARRRHWKREHQPLLSQTHKTASSSSSSSLQCGMKNEKVGTYSLSTLDLSYQSKPKNLPELGSGLDLKADRVLPGKTLLSHTDSGHSPHRRRHWSGSETSPNKESCSSLKKDIDRDASVSFKKKKKHKHHRNSKHSRDKKLKKEERQSFAGKRSQDSLQNYTLDSTSEAFASQTSINCDHTHAHAGPVEILEPLKQNVSLNFIDLSDDDGSYNKTEYDKELELKDDMVVETSSANLLASNVDFDKSGTSANFAAMGLFQCEHCGEIFTKRAAWLGHLKTHGIQTESGEPRDGDSRYKCRLCKRSFKSKSDRVKHMKRAHTELSERSFKCKVCHRAFVFQHELSKHEEACIHGEVPSSRVCKFCHLTFPSARRCKAHEEKHKSGKSSTSKCRHCHRLFTTKYFRALHEKQSHTQGDPKPLSCHYCERMFENEILLKLHIKKKHKWKASSSEGKI